MMYAQAKFQESLKSANGDWDWAKRVYEEYSQMYFDGGEQNMKYLVIDFGNIPLSSEVIYSAAGDEQKLKMKLRMNECDVQKKEKINNIKGVEIPVTYTVMWQFARTDIQPKLKGAVKQKQEGQEQMDLLNDMTNGMAGMSM